MRRSVADYVEKHSQNIHEYYLPPFFLGGFSPLSLPDGEKNEIINLKKNSRNQNEFPESQDFWRKKKGMS